MDLKEYLQPVDDSHLVNSANFLKNQIGSRIAIHSPTQFPDLTDAKIAIVGVSDERGNPLNPGCANSPNHIRKQFYSLFKMKSTQGLVDLGNIAAGHEVFDTYYALSSIIRHLLEQDIVTIILGGTKDLTFANYQAYEGIRKYVNLTTIDCKLNMENQDEFISSGNYLSKIILTQPNILFDYANLGYQSYLVDEDEAILMDKLNFEKYRLGLVRGNMQMSEPVLRNADFISVDFNAIRQSDAPSNFNGSPNGFFGHEACQMCKYAGMSDKLTSIGFYELNKDHDPDNRSAKLMAQMIWYFIDGFYNRKGDFPKSSKKEYKKYVVPMKGGTSQIVFYKSHKTDRWWMENPVSDLKRNQFSESILTPCSYNDYETATNNEIPEVWLKTFNKLR